ncbi:response regulator [Candidatus Omnitrophota bacterium]
MSKKEKILICDDEKGVRESFEHILAERYQLSFVADGTQAIEHIRKNPADLLILDLKMPKMSGMKALKEIKKINPAQKVIVVTGYSAVSTAYQAVKAGASDYIPKPFDKEHILEAVAAALKK